MPKTIFTESQKKAHDILRHLSVTANAGSGKTTVLVSRFIDILLNTDTKIDEIVAITFTEKAASELKKKISDTLNGLLQSEKSLDRLKKIEDISNHLPSANVSTIHSFCSKMLRQFPVEANVDYGFSVLDGVDQEILIQESIQETIAVWLNNSSDKRYEELALVLRTLGKNKLQSFVKLFLGKREQVERLLTEDGILSAGKSDDDILKIWDEITESQILSTVIDSGCIEAAEKILKAGNSKKATEILQMLNVWHTAKTEDHKIKMFGEIIEGMLTQKGELRADIFGRGVDNSSVNDLVSILKDVWESSKELIEVYCSYIKNKHQIILLNITRVALSLYKDTLKIYELKKNEKSYLDYEDLQLKTYEMLKSSEVQQKLASKFKYIMVDEYQDTNLLQYEIFRKLLFDLQSGNLFIVGDPKQSIYGFRNAEVEVFEKTKQDITHYQTTDNEIRWNGNAVVSTADERKGKIVLAESFRLLTDIVCFVNVVFAKILVKGSHQFEVEYNELLKCRNNSASGKVELLLLKPSNEKEKIIEIECEAIARRIINLVQTKYQIYDAAETPNDFRFKDAAILLRSRTHLKKLELILNKYKIPYVITGGIGFYQTQEIYDFYNYFQFLLNRHNDVALVGLLRSPFFTLSDAELFEIANHTNGSDFWSKLKSFIQTENVSDNAKRAVNILDDNISYASRLPIPLLVQRIFRQTGWLGTIAGLQRGEQSRLNVDKLLRLARNFEGKGFANLYDFVERLKTLIAGEQREGQASIESDGNAVQIMTIHSAKGLEFPVVFVPFLDKKFKYDNAPYIDSKVGIGFQAMEENSNDQKIDPLIYRFLKQQSHLKTEAEEKRIFYVACTRAKDVLVLSGSLPENSKSALNWVLKSLNINSNEIMKGEHLVDNLKVKTINLENNNFLHSEIDYLLNLQIYTAPEHIEIVSEDARVVESEKSIGDILIKSRQGQIRSNFFSATQIQTFKDCPTKYFLKYQLGMPEFEMRSIKFHEEDDPNDRIYRGIVGSITHSVLEKYQSFNEKDISSFILQNLKSEFVIEDEKINQVTNDILLQVKNYFESDFGKTVIRLPEYKTEFTLNTVFGDDYLTGTLDRLYKSQEGKWCILDYKTDNVTLKNIKNKADRYYWQMAFYSVLVARFLEVDEIEATLVFTKYPDHPQIYKFSKDKIKNIETEILHVIEKIKSNQFTRNEDMCEYCNYQKNGKCISGRNL
ncbi:MAG: UvrD-helicase domain-containing protein [Bacteroidota bacterium]|nr:UvrD-helicase domain-containing protein [Bacteroidota bacterium]